MTDKTGMKKTFLLLAIAGPALTGFSPLLPAQLVGGDLEQRFRFDAFSTGDELGYAVSTAGDVDQDGRDDLVVGVLFAQPNGLNNTGSAYVYSGRTGNLIYQFDGFESFDLMGYSVSGGKDVDGDGVPDVFVGAPHADPNGHYNAGSAFVFSGATGLQIHRFDGASDEDLLGNSVALAGDMDGDGLAELVVGAVNTTVNGVSQAGSVFVFSGGSGALLYRIDGSDPVQTFGKAVANAGDTDGDGFADFLVGTPDTYLNNHVVAGSVFVYSGATGNLLLRLNGPSDGFRFGTSVAGAGDLDGDGLGDLLVGNRTASAPRDDPGTVFAFSGANGRQIFRFDGDADTPSFGRSVAGPGDVDGDGVPDILVGATFSSEYGPAPGNSAFLFSGATGALLFRFDGLTYQNGLGISVSGAGDVNGDGRADLILGAPFEQTETSPDQGAAFVFTFNPILEASAGELSIASGGTIGYAIDFSEREAFSGYRILLSFGGTGPTSLRGLAVPLTRDRFFLASLKGNTPPQARGFQGRLDALGRASARITALPGGLPAKLAGRALFLSAVDKRLDLASVARKLAFLP